MDTMTLAIVVVAAVAAIAFFAWVQVSAWRLQRGQVKAEPREYANEPAHCSHEWKVWESGTCMRSYSSYGGPDPQETWTVERCPLCGAQTFSCTGSCDCYAECAAPYEG